MSDSLELALECFAGGRAIRADGRECRYLVLPSRQDPRYLLPLGNSRAMLRSFEIYRPFAGAPRFWRSSLSRIAGMRVSRWALPALKVAEPLGLKSLVTNITGEREPVFAVVVGPPGKYRKLAIQVMRPQGETLGYMKLGLTKPAVERVRREASVLADLSALRPQVPAVLYAGEWQNSYILFQTALEGHPGPAKLSGMHVEFLERLAAIRRVDKPGRQVVEEVGESWKTLTWRCDWRWQQLGLGVLEAAARDLEKLTVPCGVSHGDFAPWNTRVRNGQLAVFDWESGEDGVPLGWDTCHFNVQVAVLRKKKWPTKFDLAAGPGAHGLFLLYLLSSLAKSLDERAENNAGLEYRKQVLMAELTRLRNR